jgi:hypothetical protein
MANFCSECGSALSPGARFCATCGAATSSVAGEAPAAAAPPPEQPQTGPAPEDAPPSRRPTGLLVGGAALLAVTIGGGTWLGLSSSGTGANDAPLVETGKAASTERATLYAVAEANLRDQASLEGSKIVGSLKRGEKVSGTLLTDERDKPWLQIDGKDQYVSLANLSKIAPPSLVSVDGSDRMTSGACTMMETASAGAATKASLKPGAPVRLVGVTADGFTEYGLPGGGVGYVAASSTCETKPSPAKGAVANNLIQFDARTCELGDELQPYFEEARASRASLAGDETDEEYDYPIDKKFRGLRVTAVIVGYEWQGVAFGDPADKVRDTFRQMGFEIDKQGDFAVEDDVVVSASIRPTDPGSKNRGKSELTCGV